MSMPISSEFFEESLQYGSSKESLSLKISQEQQRQKYLLEKKSIMPLKHQSSLVDPSLELFADWLMVRGLLKKWTKLWCVIKAGMLVLYKSKQLESRHWLGTVLLNYCELLERPSKMKGFCFTIFHSFEESIWAERSTRNSITKLLPTSYLILLAPSEQEGKCFMMALEKAIHCCSYLPGSTVATPELSDIGEYDETHCEYPFKNQEENYPNLPYGRNSEPSSNRFSGLDYSSSRSSESEDESLLWINQSEQEQLGDASSQGSSNTSTNEGEIGEGSSKSRTESLTDADSIICSKETLSRNDSYQHQRQKYLLDKQMLTLKRQSSLVDPTLKIYADWLMVRDFLKQWTKFWCVIKPGMLLLYKSNRAESMDWIGTVLLNYCLFKERPSKIKGFCFTILHTFEQPMWATKNPEGKTIKSVVQLLPWTHLILLASSEAERKGWMDALEKAFPCPPLLGSTGTTHELPDKREWHENPFTDPDPNDPRLPCRRNHGQDSSQFPSLGNLSSSLLGSEEENQEEHEDTVSYQEGEIEETTQRRKKVTIMNYINFPKFSSLELREGATKDSKNLRSTFEGLGYEVNIREDMNTVETNKLLDDIAQDTSLRFLLLFVLSHGVDGDTFFLSDGLQYSLKDIQYKFTDRNCPHLRGSSKIIFSNFCRGDNIEKLQYDSINVPNQPNRSETPHNMITIHASHEGFKAGRTPRRGTLFVHNICEVLKSQPKLPIQIVFNQIYDKMAKDIGPQTPTMEVSPPFPDFTF